MTDETAALPPPPGGAPPHSIPPPPPPPSSSADTTTPPSTNSKPLEISVPNATLYVSNIDWGIKKPVLKRALLALFGRHGKVRGDGTKNMFIHIPHLYISSRVCLFVFKTLDVIVLVHCVFFCVLIFMVTRNRHFLQTKKYVKVLYVRFFECDNGLE